MISILNKRASTHQNWCEDNYWVYEKDDFILGAVLDGCSTGINSYFASTVIKYSLEKSINQFQDDDIRNGDVFLSLLYHLLGDLNAIKADLRLSEMNLLSTIVFFKYNKRSRELTVKFIGDGVCYVNGHEIVNDENNTPDYFAYHLSDDISSFFNWIDSKRIEKYSDVLDFSICSDGIHSLINLKDPHINQRIAIDFLVINNEWKNLSNGLNRKFNILMNRDSETKRSEELYWWDIKDDLTIIRYATL